MRRGAVMDAEDRRKLVRDLIENYGDISSRELELMRREAEPSDDFIYEHLKRCILALLLLSQDEQSDDITQLVEKSLERLSAMDSSLLAYLKTAKTCNDLSSAATRKVVLFYRLRRELGAQVKATAMTRCSTVRELSSVLADGLRKKRGDQV